MTQRTDHPKIETWAADYDWKRQTPHNSRPLVTTWHATVFEARKARAESLGIPVTSVCGRKVERVQA